MQRRAAVYARFSTELQNDRSVEDQTTLCEDFALRTGLEVVGRYHDRARSGTTTHGRDGLHRLLHDARAGEFDVVVVEALDRLSRDTEDLAGLHKRLTFAGIQIVAVHDGLADALQVGIRGLVSTLWINDLRHKTRRGLAAVVKDGRHAGGRAYGYRTVLGHPGVLEICESEAEIVRRIFCEYLAGAAPRDIANRLNAEGIPAPRGAKWAASTINGNKQRGHGIILNALYSGRIVWNKTRMVRDPDTGRRVPRANPESEWKVAEVPDLAIIPPPEWQRAQAEKAGRSHDMPVGVRRRTRLLSGLLRCPVCGGGMTMHDRRGDAIRIKCSTMRESGSCTNTKSYRLDLIEKAVVSGLIDRMRRPEWLEHYIEAQQEDRRGTAKARAAAERSVAKVEGEIDRLRKALIAGRVDEDFFDREIAPLRRDLAEAKARLAEAPDAQIVVLHPAALRQYADLLTAAAPHLTTLDPETDKDVIDAIRALIDRVVVHDRPDGRVEVDVIGHLSALIGVEGAADWGGTVVARGRYTRFPPISFGRFAA
jgi:site-specific DNA recombinase